MDAALETLDPKEDARRRSMQRMVQRLRRLAKDWPAGAVLIRAECRQRWAGERETWRLWKQMEQEHASHPDEGVRAHHALCVKKARERMRWWVAARADIAARRERAAQSSSLRRVGRLCARWREEARTMEKIADEDPDSYEARECYERAATLQDCANDLEREWAGTEPTDQAQRRRE